MLKTKWSIWEEETQGKEIGLVSRAKLLEYVLWLVVGLLLPEDSAFDNGRGASSLGRKKAAADQGVFPFQMI